MYWVIHEDIYREEGMKSLLDVLERFGLPHCVHEIVPFVCELEPDATLYRANVSKLVAALESMGYE